MPQGYDDGKGTLVCKLIKSLYGLHQSGRDWNKGATRTLISPEFGLKQSVADPCLFYPIGDKTNKPLVSLFVDDVGAVGPDGK
jgi:hypothetical protein